MDPGRASPSTRSAPAGFSSLVAEPSRPGQRPQLVFLGLHVQLCRQGHLAPVLSPAIVDRCFLGDGVSRLLRPDLIAWVFAPSSHLPCPAGPYGTPASAWSSPPALSS